MSTASIPATRPNGDILSAASRQTVIPHASSSSPGFLDQLLQISFQSIERPRDSWQDSAAPSSSSQSSNPAESSSNSATRYESEKSISEDSDRANEDEDREDNAETSAISQLSEPAAQTALATLSPAAQPNLDSSATNEETATATGQENLATRKSTDLAQGSEGSEIPQPQSQAKSSDDALPVGSATPSPVATATATASSLNATSNSDKLRSDLQDSAAISTVAVSSETIGPANKALIKGEGNFLQAATSSADNQGDAALSVESVSPGIADKQVSIVQDPEGQASLKEADLSADPSDESVGPNSAPQREGSVQRRRYSKDKEGANDRQGPREAIDAERSAATSQAGDERASLDISSELARESDVSPVAPDAISGSSELLPAPSEVAMTSTINTEAPANSAFPTAPKAAESSPIGGSGESGTGGQTTVGLAGDSRGVSSNYSLASTNDSRAGGRMNADNAKKLSAQQQAKLLQRVARGFLQTSESGGQVKLRLHPPELGSLQVSVRVEGNKLSASLEAETASARDALLEGLPQLKKSLAEQGMEIEKFEVTLANSDNPGSSSGNGQSSSGFGQSGSEQSNQRRQHAHRWEGRGQAAESSNSIISNAPRWTRSGSNGIDLQA